MEQPGDEHAEHQVEAEERRPADHRAEDDRRRDASRRAPPTQERGPQVPKARAQSAESGPVRGLGGAGRRHAHADAPESTFHDWPVMAAAPSPSRNATTDATSEGRVPWGSDSPARMRLT